MGEMMLHTSRRRSRCGSPPPRTTRGQDDLIVGSVNPFELFLIFVELTAPGRAMPRLTIDQSHNIEAKVEAMTLSVVNLQEAYGQHSQRRWRRRGGVHALADRLSRRDAGAI